MASEEPPTGTAATSKQEPANSRGSMLAPYIYYTDLVQERLRCRAVASDTTRESNERAPESVRGPNDDKNDIRDLEAMMRERSSSESRL
ncbi:hypothetical protein IL306_012682 [Fusarium sp. DS 682]|nr:hypothetical protein IL306_012682 [Fusarium sp. DS 682]